MLPVMLTRRILHWEYFERAQPLGQYSIIRYLSVRLGGYPGCHLAREPEAPRVFGRQQSQRGIF